MPTGAKILFSLLLATVLRHLGAATACSIELAALPFLGPVFQKLVSLYSAVLFCCRMISGISGHQYMTRSLCKFWD